MALPEPCYGLGTCSQGGKASATASASRHGSTQAAIVSPPPPSSFRSPGQGFLVLSGEKMLKLLAKWATKHPRGDTSQEGGYLGDREGLFRGKGMRAFFG